MSGLFYKSSGAFKLSNSLEFLKMQHEKEMQKITTHLPRIEKMPRFTIEGDPIHVAYGVDEEITSGVFLSITDRRLKWNKEASEEVNKVTESIGLKDGDGSYLNLYTGSVGFGIKVTRETMRVYLTRYGISSKRIDELFCWSYGKPIGSTCSVCYKENTKICAKCHRFFYCSRECQIKDWPSHKLVCDHLSTPLVDLVPKVIENDCSVCLKKTKNTCSKCGLMSFCSKECQKKDWPNHKLVCDALPFPKKISKNHVYAFYLPEDANKIDIVQVLIANEYDEDEDGWFNSPRLKQFFGNDLGFTYILENPIKRNRVMQNMLIINYRDNFLNDDSKTNKLVQTMTNGLSSHDWRGPLVIMKAEGTRVNNDQDYLDIDLKDLSDVVDFFLEYGKPRNK